VCFYYTWEYALLCAVEPELAQDSRNACICKHYDYNPEVEETFIENGETIFYVPELGYAPAVRIDKWIEIKKRYMNM